MKEKNIKTEKKNSDLFMLETKYWQLNKLICGIDEVGRGCLAGPIVTAAVILHPHATNKNLKDSKLMSKLQIEIISNWVMKNSIYTIGISHHRIIDKNNIYNATQKTMKKALNHLLQSTDALPDLIAIDAMPLHMHDTPYKNIALESWTQGESKSASIAAASVIAKMTRDKIMQKMHGSFPVYEFHNHKGYGTATHIKAIQKSKACIMHRKTFIKNLKESENETKQQQNLFR